MLTDLTDNCFCLLCKPVTFSLRVLEYFTWLKQELLEWTRIHSMWNGVEWIIKLLQEAPLVKQELHQCKLLTSSPNHSQLIHENNVKIFFIRNVTITQSSVMCDDAHYRHSKAMEARGTYVHAYNNWKQQSKNRVGVLGQHGLSALLFCQHHKWISIEKIFMHNTFLY